jgi:integrase
VPILDPLASVLAAHLLASKRRRDDLVCGRTATEPFVPSTVRSRALKAWAAENARRIERADDPESVEALEPIGLHEARHTCASLLIEAGANPKVLSTIMGHASIGITFDVYGHLMPNGIDEAAAKVNAYIARQTGERPALTMVG